MITANPEAGLTSPSLPGISNSNVELVSPIKVRTLPFTTPAVLEVYVDTSSLAVGSHVGRMGFYFNIKTTSTHEYSASPLFVPVSVTVQPSSQTLNVTTSTVPMWQLAAKQGCSYMNCRAANDIAPMSTVMSFDSSDPSTSFRFSLPRSVNGLRVFATGGSTNTPTLNGETWQCRTPCKMVLQVDAPTFAPGTYTLQLPISAPGTANPSMSIPVSLTIVRATLLLNTLDMRFQYTPGGQLPPIQQLRFETDTGQPMSVQISTTDRWITGIRSATVTVPSALEIGINPSGLTAGTYNGTINISVPGVSSVQVRITLVVSPDLRPTISQVVNAASFIPVISPGSWISIYGTNLSKNVRTMNASPWLPLNSEGVSVQLRGTTSIHNLLLHYLDPGQINAFVPHEIGPDFGTEPELTVVTPSGTTNKKVSLAPISPALFSYAANGVRFASAVHPDGVIVGIVPGTLPARPGSIISLYGTGFGQTNPLSMSVNGPVEPKLLGSEVKAYLNGRELKVLYAGLVGIGLYQFNVEIPADTPEGDHPVGLVISGQETVHVLIPVRQ
jgi:uncharacterized protein (TIGR03437 family)